MRRAIHLFYYAHCGKLAEEALAELVTDDDRQRVTPAMRERRRDEHLAGRALLRHALSSMTGQHPASFRIEVSASGKPVCAGAPPFSVSHSGDFVVCAVADTAVESVGVDMEAALSRESFVTIAERWFTPAEAEWVAADPKTRFRMLWVLKEAYLKALGAGLSGGLRSLECRVDPPKIYARTAAEAMPPELALFTGRAGDVAVAALGGGQVDVSVRPFVPRDGVDTLGPLRLVATT
jgi:4'-phosphopantetheinyl transferase